MQKGLIYAIVGAIIIVGAFYLFSGSAGPKETAVYSTNTTLEGDYTVVQGEQTTLEHNAVLTIKGNLMLDGVIGCRDGGIEVIVEGMTTIAGGLTCEGEDGADAGIMLVAQGGLTLADTADLSSNGSIQLVDDASLLLRDDAAINRVWEDTARDSGAGERVGPLVDDGTVATAHTDTRGISLRDAVSYIMAWVMPKTARAQAPVPVVISGKIRVATPPAGVKRLVLFAFPHAQEVRIQNFTLTGPDGRKGTDDTGANCSAKGKNGEDAFRFNASAPNMKVSNFTLNLGNGGDGGAAQAKDGCDTARAEGGNGGSSGNFKMTGGSSFAIEGAFLINPGRGGAGGNAQAKGKDGAANEKGGSATAIGGKGADNKKKLSVRGTVAGTENVEVGDLMAGDGGWATADGGKGGDAAACGQAGAAGGAAVARGGAGGNAKLTLGGSARRAELAKDIGGKGGQAESAGGAGGNGGSCGADKAGGNGGIGGSANSTEGKGGSGTNGNNNDGAVLDETGGAGGQGGDGCKEGKGGVGGAGDPKGEDGKPGKNLCVPAEKKTDVTVGGGTQPAKTIKVIEYNGKYLPVDQLIVESESGCDGGQAHWHAAQGVVVATDGSQVYDPGPQCGYGKVSQKPTMTIPQPQ